MSVVKGLHSAMAFDYHYEKKIIFWTENNLRVIRVAQMNNNNISGKIYIEILITYLCFI